MTPDPIALSRGQRLALTAASFLLIAVATMALGPLISGSGWWWMCALVAAGTLFGGAGLRAIRTPASLVPVLELVILVLLLTLLFGGATSFALIVPTTGTFTEFGELLGGAERTIQQQSVPAIPVPALSFALALGVGLLAVCIDILVQTVRMPALAAAPALVPILIPGFIIEAGAEAPTLVLAAAAYLLLLRVDVRVRRRARIAAGDEGDDAATVISPARVPIASTLGATLGLGGAGLVIAAVLAASTPSISTSLLLGTGSPGSIFGRGVSPFIDLGRDLRRPDPRPAFHYFSPDGERPYFTLLTLDRFEGATWGVTESQIDGDNTVDAMPEPDGLSSDVLTEEHPIDVTIDEVRTTWLPVPYPTTRVDGLRGSWFWEDGSLTVRGVDADTVRPALRGELARGRPDARRSCAPPIAGSPTSSNRSWHFPTTFRRSSPRPRPRWPAPPRHRTTPPSPSRRSCVRPTSSTRPRRRSRRATTAAGSMSSPSSSRAGPATACTSRRRWRCWPANRVFRRASRSATRREARRRSASAACSASRSTRTTCMRGPNSTSKESGGCRSNRRPAEGSFPTTRDRARVRAAESRYRSPAVPRRARAAAPRSIQVPGWAARAAV